MPIVTVSQTLLLSTITMDWLTIMWEIVYQYTQFTDEKSEMKGGGGQF